MTAAECAAAMLDTYGGVTIEDPLEIWAFRAQAPPSDHHRGFVVRSVVLSAPAPLDWEDPYCTVPRRVELLQRFAVVDP